VQNGLIPQDGDPWSRKIGVNSIQSVSFLKPAFSKERLAMERKPHTQPGTLQPSIEARSGDAQRDPAASSLSGPGNPAGAAEPGGLEGFTEGPTNEDRSGHAETALKAYAQVTGLSLDPVDGEQEVAIKDLLADLMHYSDQKGLDFEHVLDGARRFHAEELGEVGCLRSYHADAERDRAANQPEIVDVGGIQVEIGPPISTDGAWSSWPGTSAVRRGSGR